MPDRTQLVATPSLTGLTVDQLDDATPADLHVLIYGNEQAKQAIIRKVKQRSGRRHKRERGGYAGHGSPRYGWRAEGRELVPDPAEQAGVYRVWQLHAAGATLRQICRTLEAEGYRPKRGGPGWHTETIRRILAGPAPVLIPCSHCQGTGMEWTAGKLF